MIMNNNNSNNNDNHEYDEDQLIVFVIFTSISCFQILSESRVLWYVICGRWRMTQRQETCGLGDNRGILRTLLTTADF